MTAKERAVLTLLGEHGESRGLDLVHRSPLLRRGTVYVTLSRLGDQGYVLRAVHTDDPRPVYNITDEGRRALAEPQLPWTQRVRNFLFGE